MKIKMINIVTLILITLCLTGWIVHPIPVVKEGIASLEDWDFEKDGTVSLDGEWNFYWETDEPSHLSAAGLSLIEVSSGWEEENQFPSSGYGLYHIQLKGLEVGKNYGLKIPTMSNSYRLWIDEKLMITNGTPGKTKETTIPYYKPQEVFFDAHSDTVNIYLNIANFHYRSGGMWSSLKFGTSDQITGLTKRNLAFEAIIIGSLLLSGLYHLVLFLNRRKEKILLMFGVTCLVIAARTIVIGEQVVTILFQNVPWELIVKTEYLTFYTAVPLFLWFMHELYNQEVSKFYCKVLTFISLLFSLLVIFTPAIVYTNSLFLFQSLTVITIVYIIFALIRAAVRKREGAKVVLICAFIYALTVINDILYINGNIDSTNLSSFGQFIFIFSQCFIIAKSLSKAFQKVEVYSNQLAELNQTLEEKIYDRTKSLEDSKHELQRVNEVLKELSYQDQLTNLPNRRYFDDLYEIEWENALTNQTMISILYFDIDHFKYYNDAYGHEQGDITLQKVAACLQKSIQKYGGTVARIGGEEFIAIISNMNPDQTNLIAEECRSDVKQLLIPHKKSSTSPFVTISIGVATTVPVPKFSKRKLIRTADEALYFAKEDGRNQVVLSSSF
jgi:diguanylate cyclase (GGDEF)-like protein